MSSRFSSVLTNNGSPRKLHQGRLLRLAVLKLDGSSFEIEVAKSGTVGEVKKAVESAFRHLPKTGPNKVSWEHLWGQFCLCHERQKLLNDGDYLSLINIKDGDQFVHHASTTYNWVKRKSKREDDDDLDSDNERPIVSKDRHVEIRRRKLSKISSIFYHNIASYQESRMRIVIAHINERFTGLKEIVGGRVGRVSEVDWLESKCDFNECRDA